MIAMHVPHEAPAESPVAISPSDKTIVHGCMQIGVDSQATWAERYVDTIFIVKIHNNITDGDITNTATALVVKPEHGAIVDIIDSKTGYHNYRYDPQPGYTGKDKATFVVSINGKTYRVVTDLIVVKDVYDGVNSSDSDPCDNSNPGNNNGDVSTPNDAVTVGISSLDGGAVGKTDGNATAITQVSGLKDATMLSVGADHACALTHGGGVRCWGRNAAAQLGSLYDLMQPGLPADGGMTAHVVFGFADDAAH